MASQFSPKVSQILAFSREEASRLSSSSVGPEHLLLSLLREKSGPVRDFFIKFDADIAAIKSELEEKVREDNRQQQMIYTHELVLNEKASNILKLAVLEARLQTKTLVDVQHLLLAILHDQVENGARMILEQNNMNYEDALTFFSQKKESIQPTNGIGLPEDFDEDEEQPAGNNTGKARSNASVSTPTQKTGGKTPMLDNFSVDLTQAAREGNLDPIVGREKEILRVSVRVLSWKDWHS